MIAVLKPVGEPAEGVKEEKEEEDKEEDEEGKGGEGVKEEEGVLKVRGEEVMTAEH